MDCKEMVRGYGFTKDAKSGERKSQWQHTERYNVGRLACADKQMDRQK